MSRVPAFAGRPYGWSLVELAVGLVIAALLTVLLVTLLPLGSRILDREHQQQELAQAEEALLGYARVHSQLPAADGDGDGKADGSPEGWLPVHDLALSSRMRIRYQVQPHLALAPTDLFRPLLSPDYDVQTAGTVNGLDFCMRLLLDQRSGTSMAGLGIPVSYYLAHSGGSGQDRADADEFWDASAQILPGSSATTEAVALAAAGPGEFAARLSCPDRLARAQGNAQSALAGYSAKRMADFNLKFRRFDVKVAELTLDQAETGLAFAAVALAMAIADEAIAITLTAAGWPPEGLAIAIGIGEHVVALASIGFAAYQVKLAEDDLKNAEQGITDANDNLGRAETSQTRVESLYISSSLNAIRLDKAGVEQ